MQSRSLVVVTSLILLTSCKSARHGESADKTSSRAEDRQIAYQGPVSSYSKGSLLKQCQESLATAKSKLDGLSQTPEASQNFATIQLQFETILTQLSLELAGPTFMASVSTNKKVSDDANECQKLYEQFFVGVLTRKDLYELLRKVTPKTVEQRRLQKETLLGFEENGMKLPDSEREKVKVLLEKMAANGAEFSKNLNNDATQVTFTSAELKGVPAEDLTRFTKKDDQYTATTKYSDYNSVMGNAESEEARKRMRLAYVSRAGDVNAKILEDSLKLREQAAKILGHKSWADYKLVNRMAKTSARVWEMINSLKKRVAERNKRDLKILLDAKRAHTNNPQATLSPWDVDFYDQLVRKQKYSVDENLVQEYFPKDYVVQSIFEIYSTLLGVKFEKIQNPVVWSPDVEMFKVLDAKSSQLVAYIFMDLFPRQGKYGHAAAFTLNPGYQSANGYSIPSSAMVTNFPPASSSRPSVLPHREVETFFHEFGHIMHQVLTRAPYASLAGTSVKRDFVEAPSQMLEEWVWQPEILKKLSRHYKTGEPLPDDLIQKMIAARGFNKGYHYTRQLMLGTFDMTMHTAPQPVDVRELYNKLYKDLIGLDAEPGGSWVSGFEHMLGGYDAGYYGYLWSEVYAADMFSKFKSEGLLSPKVGIRYREWILEKGNMFEPEVLLTNFLGRPPNNAAFLRKLNQ